MNKKKKKVKKSKLQEKEIKTIAGGGIGIEPSTTKYEGVEGAVYALKSTSSTPLEKPKTLGDQ
jgi:hypothetical protein